jgi:hypothetical protein
MNVFILVVLTHVYNGQNLTFQEFNSLEQCKYTLSLINTKANYIDAAFCVKK